MMNNNKTIYLDGKTLSIEDVINIAENSYRIELNENVKKKIVSMRQTLEKELVENPHRKIYGTNVGCGDLKDSEITPESFEKYQKKYIKAHNCGTGKPLQEKIVRAIMVIRLNSFAKGISAVRIETCEMMIKMLNRHITPWVLEEGSVGASGDLVPLAMIGASLIGLPESKVYFKGELTNSIDALKKVGLQPTKLGAKEAMGLTNGSTFIAATAIFAYRDIDLLIKNASISSALSLEAIRGESNAFSEEIHLNRPHRGQLIIAKHIRNLIENSKRMSEDAQMDFFKDEESLKKVTKELYILEEKINDSTELKGLEQANKLLMESKEALRNSKVAKAFKALTNLKKIFIQKKQDTIIDLINNTLGSFKYKGRVQDRYSFRSIPQVHGPVCEALEKLKAVLEIEINSATDNPLFFYNEEDKFEVKSGGNFHGQPLAAVIDYLKITLTSLGLITDKRTFSLLDKDLSYGLPSDLAISSSAGDTGLMITQYAGVARAAESRILATPASVMSISTSANQEDFVSLGSIGVIHLQKIIYNTQILVAIEILCSIRALQMTYNWLPKDLRSLGFGTRKIYNKILRILPPVTEDQYLRLDMEKCIELVKTGQLVEIVEGLLK